MSNSEPVGSKWTSLAAESTAFLTNRPPEILHPGRPFSPHKSFYYNHLRPYIVSSLVSLTFSDIFCKNKTHKHPKALSKKHGFFLPFWRSFC